MSSSSAVVTEFALIAAVCWGIGDFAWARAAKKIGPVLSIALAATIEPPIMLVFYLLSDHHWAFNGVAYIYSALAGVVFTLGGTVFFMGLKKGPVSLVSPIASMYPIVTTLLALFVFRSHLTLLELLGIGIVLIGILLASGITSVKKTKLKLTGGVKLGLLTLCFWGVAYSLLTQSIKRIGWLNTTLLEIWFGSLFLPLILPLVKGRAEVSIRSVISNLTDKNIWFATAVNLSGFVALSFAISKSTSNGGAVAAAISSCYPIITIVLALRHFKEEVKPVSIIGALVGIFGIVLLSIA